ncbi:MAG: CoA transferase [Chloroflexi bacterium]|nr:CoA transferase [Chloroflexota bacterium]
MPQPLDDILVIDLTRVLAGPFCTMNLADLGAEVIKVEQPGRGDDTRQWGPPFAGGESAYYLSVNRNKKGITLNFAHPKARDILRALVTKADVLIENFKSGTMESWGLGYEELRKLNTGLIYCNISGYGRGGPDEGRLGYDFVIQAEGGLMSLTGPIDGMPYRHVIAIVDITTGMYAATGIIAALRARDRSGIGQRVDLSLLESQVAWLANLGQYTLVTGQSPRKYGNAHSTVVPYEVFKCTNGYFVLACGNDGQFAKLARIVRKPELATDARFATNPSRVTNRAALFPILEDAFATFSVDDVLAQLREAGVPAGRINSLEQTLSDPQVLHREMVVEVDHPTAGKLKLLGVPYKFSETPVGVHSPPPLLGQHTAEVLRELLGYDAGTVETLRAEGVI